MSRSARRSQLGFSFLEVLLVLGIVGLMIICLFGFLLSRTQEPLKIPPTPASATPAPALPPSVPAP